MPGRYARFYQVLWVWLASCPLTYKLTLANDQKIRLTADEIKIRLTADEIKIRLTADEIAVD